MSLFEKENILDKCHVFYRLHQSFFNKKGKLSPGVFQDRGNGMSVDWKKYSTPEETQMRAPKNPKLNKIGELNVGEIRKIELKVEHTPDELTRNRAHSDVFGTKSEKVQLALWELCQNKIYTIQ